jgi:hypothetical protein
MYSMSVARAIIGHVRGREFAYRFTSPARLIGDFLADVADVRSKL